MNNFNWANYNNNISLFKKLSKFNKKTFLGKCNSCLEMCGLNK